MLEATNFTQNNNKLVKDSAQMLGVYHLQILNILNQDKYLHLSIMNN